MFLYQHGKHLVHLICVIIPSKGQKYFFCPLIILYSFKENVDWIDLNGVLFEIIGLILNCFGDLLLIKCDDDGKYDLFSFDIDDDALFCDLKLWLFFDVLLSDKLEKFINDNSVFIDVDDVLNKLLSDAVVYGLENIGVDGIGSILI